MGIEPTTSIPEHTLTTTKPRWGVYDQQDNSFSRPHLARPDVRKGLTTRAVVMVTSDDDDDPDDDFDATDADAGREELLVNDAPVVDPIDDERFSRVDC